MKLGIEQVGKGFSAKTFWPDMRWNMRLLVRSTVDEANIASAVRREVQSIDPAQPLYAVQTMNLVIENTDPIVVLRHQ